MTQLSGELKRPIVPQKTLALLGIGHTNAHVVERWATHSILGYRLVCVSNFATAAYSGMLPGTLARQFDDTEMRIRLQPLIERAGGELILGNVSGIDLPKQQLTFNDRDAVRFDMLSIGVGSMPVGLDSHASPMIVPIKPMQDFISRLDNRVDALLKRDKPEPIRIAIVGGGVAGVEIAFCLRQRLRERECTNSAVISIFTSGTKVADGMRPRSVRLIENLLAQHSIAIHPLSRVARVSNDFLVTDDDREHAVDCVIWATGAGPSSILRKLALQKDERGFIATSNTLQSLTDKRVFAVGDCGTIIASPCPKAGVYAVRQSPVLWHNLNAFAKGRSLQTFAPQKDFLKLLNTGDGKALLEYKVLTTHGRWCLRLKNWIDRRFVSGFQ